MNIGHRCPYCHEECVPAENTLGRIENVKTHIKENHPEEADDGW